MTHNNLKILIVDDVPDNIFLLNKLLGSKGYEIASSNSGERALDIVGKLMPDLILLDVMMPGIDGIETCKRMKSIPIVKEIPILFITARSDIETVLEGFSAGAVDYLTKPFNEQEVFARIKTQLNISLLQKKQKQLIEQIQLQNKYFNATLSSVSDAIITFDRHGQIKTTNKGFERLFGFSLQESKDMNIANLFDIEKKEIIETCNIHKLKDIISEKSKKLSLYGVTKQNSKIPIEFFLTPFYVEQESMYVGVFHDITFHKKTLNKIQVQSETDSLTGISNRSKFDKFIGIEIMSAKKKKTSIALMLLDVDYFKQYNDTYGHIEGDRCLKKVAQCIQNSLNRSEDMVFRYGGEEFSILLPGVSNENAITIAKRICHNIEGLGIKHESSDVSDYVTVSIGLIVKTPENNCTVTMLVDMADQHLYKAKNNGRNQISSSIN